MKGFRFFILQDLDKTPTLLSGGDVLVFQMSDGDDSYSFDDDFADDERLGLTSICEETEKSSASYSFDDDFVSQTTSEHKIPSSSYNESITVNDEKRSSNENDYAVPVIDNTCSESHSYSLDHHDESYIGNVSEATDASIVNGKFARDCDVKSNNDNEPQPKQAGLALPACDKNSYYTNASATKLTTSHTPLQPSFNDKQPEEFGECKEDPKSHEAYRAGHLFDWERQGSAKKKYKRKTPAPLPRCATLATKCMSKSEPVTEQRRKSKHKYSVKRLQVLAQPRKHHIYVQENSDTNLKAKPTKKKTHAKSQQDNFLERIEVMERERREKVDYARGKS